MCEVALPNKEIAFVYNKEILSKLENIVPQSLAISIQEAIYENNADKLKVLLEKLLRESVSSFDTSREIFYHGLVLGLCAIFSDSYYVTSNRESGEGRYDIQLMPKKNNRPGFIFELKAEKECTQDKLQTVAQGAVQQIVKRKYETEMQMHGVQSIIKYGVAFGGKSVEIVTA